MPSLEELLLSEMSDGAYRVDRQRRIVSWNPGAEHLTGYTADEVLGKRCAEGLLRHVDDLGCQLCTNGCPLAATMKDGEVREADVYLHHKDGHRVPVRVRSHPVHDEGGAIVGSLELFKLRASNRFADGVAELSSPDYQRDLVSGLGDRRFGDSRLNAALQDASEGGTLGLLFVDIDNFKDVNDTLGHPTGDRVIHMVGQTLANSVRASDVPVRWGGEEFLVLLPGVTPEELETSAERIRMLVENSFLSHSRGVLQVTVSVGAAMAFPGEGPVALVERADRLMYASKRSGRNRVTSEAGLVPRASSQPLGPGLFKRKVKAS